MRFMTALASFAAATLIAASAAHAMPIIDPAPPPSSIAAPAAESYSNLRAAGASQQIATAPVAAGPSAEGFDWPSALIGAAAALGVGLVLVAAFGMRSSARITPAR